MIFLKRNRLWVGILPLFLSGCISSSYKLLRQNGLAAELKVSPDRIRIECEYQYDNDVDDAYGFLMRVLDDKNSFITIAQMNVLDKQSCLRRLNKIGRILKTGLWIYIGGMGQVTKPRKREEKQHSFPGHGKFPGNGRTLQFAVIANESGLCYDAYSGDEPPCPREPFSFENLK